jgi:hypothetical protein
MCIFKNLLVLGVSLVFVSCGALENFNQPLTNVGYDPLDRLGIEPIRNNNSANNDAASLVKANDHGFNNGDIVEVVIPNTALFKKVPKAGDRYEKVLNVGDSLRVIGGEKDFIKVVTETGEIGFVSSVMVVTQGFLTNTGPIDPNVTVVGANEKPIVPDVAPDPTVQGIGSPDPAPGLVPSVVPKITPPVPVVPDPEPVVPSLPDAPAPDPSDPGLPE